MKRPALASLLFLAQVLPVAVGHGQPQPPDSSPLSDVQVNGRANPCVRLRAGASTDHSAVDCLEPGTRLRLLGEISNWSQVRLLDGTEGWIDSGYLEAAPALSAVQPAATLQAVAEPATDLQGQIESLEAQLQAMSARRDVTEDRLSKTVAAAEEAQREASQLRQRVQQLESEAGADDRSQEIEAQLTAERARATQLEESLAAAESGQTRAAGLNAEQERRIEAMDASLTAGRTREAELQQTLAAAQQELRNAEETNAKQTARITELEAAPPPDPPRRAELKRELRELRAQLSAAEEANAQQASRITQLEADLPSAQDRESELHQALAAAEARAAIAEQRQAEQAQRIEDLGFELADAERRIAEAMLKSRLAGRAGPSTERPAERGVTVRAPIDSAPEAPKVSVRMPAAVSERDAAPPPKMPAEEPIPTTDAAVSAIRAWAAAWSDQRVDDYLSFYAPGFRPPGGLGRGEWEAQRRQRLRRPAFIRVTISDLDAKLAEDGTVTATFRQEYESDSFADTVTKVMTLAEEDGAWRLLVERATP